MSVFRGMIIAFSMYSRIPMPIFKWEEKDMKHVITFLPVIGVVIGGLEYAVIKLTGAFDVPYMVATLLLTMVPILVTGGFHLDGFMDVQDAIRSYQSKEKKLEIMKDPHIGAFAVIGIMSLGIIWVTALYFVTYKALSTENPGLLYLFAVIFSFVRSTCGITCVMFQNAKKEGMLNMETEKAGKGGLIFLVVECLISFAVMLLIKPLAAIVLAGILLIYSTYYKKQCEHNFGGVTGDTSGYYIVMSECILTVAIAFLSIWG